MGKLNFRKTGLAIELDNGVNPNYFITDTVLDSRAREILALFQKYGYEFATVPGSFIKAFTADKEIGEFVESLEVIKAMKLENVFVSDLKLAHFKRSFIRRVNLARENNIAFQNEDGTFIKALNNDEDFKIYLDSKKITPAKVEVTNNTSNLNEKDEVLEARIACMDEFELGLYNSVAERLNYLILANATNESLVNILKLAIRRFAEAILNKEYELPKEQMLEAILSDIGLAKESDDALLLLDAISDLNISVERGRAA